MPELFLYYNFRNGTMAAKKAAEEGPGEPGNLVTFKDGKIDSSLLPNLMTVVSKEKELEPGEHLEIEEPECQLFQVAVYEDGLGWRNLFMQEFEEIVGRKFESGKTRVTNESGETRQVKLMAWLTAYSYQEQSPERPPAPELDYKTHEKIVLDDIPEPEGGG